ncbi:SDR family oxidoreductase [Rhizobium halophytocola]|uniref:3-oxoacyl-[acyl-carrier protein] reductase n=1 Tax=Rhizobium halophytocola TaxID=735519 RepID=A0ABS4E394_9HYPH|nr:SDR family oxidoreductase [Rhizobium halophytocola]MBP1852420.1 3-oxoacyl-[acyl-carrier protein] reductase [Rhizobium halophytocola]
MTETVHPTTAIVTGSSKGIGAAIARRLARDGHAVVVNYARGAEEAAGVVAEIEAAGGRAVAVQADIGVADGITRLFDAAEKAFGPVGILVNNAGIMKLSPLANVSDADFEQHMAINVGGVFRGMREAANRLADGGRIISFSTSVVGMKLPGYGVYAATKAAVETMTHILAKELGGRKITVNAVAPGPVETELFLNGKSEELLAQLRGQNPQKRFGQPDDIARVVSFLAGPDGQWVSGQVIRANGGVV